MKILFCITRSDTIGGAHIHVADMAVWLAAQGHDVMVLVGGDGVYCDVLKRRGIEYKTSRHLRRDISLRHDLAAVRELRGIFRAVDPHLLSLHSTKAGVLGRIAAIGLPSAVLFTAHGWSFTQGIDSRKAALYRFVERMVARFADRIVTVSDFDRDLALAAGIGNAKKVVTVHNAMPDCGMMADVGASGSPVRIVMVARLDRQKDHRTLFQAIAELRVSYWLLDLVGDGPQEASLREEAVKLGISNRVRFLGLRNDVADILAEADIFVLASKWEGFPRSILEAMRAGLPVIATAVGGTPESVSDGVTGFLVPAGDSESLKEKIKALIESPSLRIRMGAAARQEYEINYRFERMARQTLSVYDEMLDGITSHP